LQESFGIHNGDAAGGVFDCVGPDTQFAFRVFAYRDIPNKKSKMGLLSNLEADDGNFRREERLKKYLMKKKISIFQRSKN
jgi:hypothetical protein